MPRAEVDIVNKLGLHARASAKLTQTACRFKSDIFLERDGQRVDAKSIMNVMMLAAACGSKVIIDVEGEDATDAMRALQELIADKFGEGE